jgi:lipopolysaccharide kinase (Kdo/WaaP) family protein
MRLSAHNTQRNGWQLVVADDPALSPEVLRMVLELADCEAAPLRRSRSARTFVLRAAAGQQEADLFVKHLDPPTGWARLKSWFRRSRRSRTQRITTALRAAGFSVPPILLHGVHCESGREVIVTLRAEGEGPILALRSLNGSISAKRAILYALGAEVGRLHRAGFIHGDLTPFNLRIAIDEPPRFAFIDNERTRGTVVVARRRRRLRNLVQLGRFALPGITRTDRMRVFRAYERALYRRHSRSLERMAARLLHRRMERCLNSDA